MIYYGLIFAQVFTFCAYVVVSAGAALLQYRANHLPLWDGLNETSLAATQAVYNHVFQSTTYIIPYPDRPQYQFQYQWWIIEFQFFIFVITAGLTAFPAFISRGRPVALALLSVGLVQVLDNVNAVFFLLRDDTAKAVYEEYRIETVQAGLIMVGCANFMTIIFLGLYEDGEYDVMWTSNQMEKAPAKVSDVTVQIDAPDAASQPQ